MLTACLVACGTTTENSRLGRFTPTGFYNDALPYRVAYGEPATQSILGAGWKLDNFVPVKKSRTRTVLEVEQRGEGPHDVVLLDDGESMTRRRVHRQDLRFVHATSGAMIWLTSTPLARRTAEESLFELTARHVQAIEEHGFPSAVLGAELGARRWRSRVLSQRDVRVDGLKAFETTLELAPAAGSTGPSKFVRLVALRAPFEWRIDDQGFRALLILGYASTRSNFATQVADFERFVNQVEIDYDDALRKRTRKVLLCTEPASDTAEVRLDVGERGQITDIDPLRPWFDPIEPMAYQTEQVQAEKEARRTRGTTCLQSALAGVRLLATDEARELRARFDARLPAGVRVAGAYRTGPFTGEALASAAPPAEGVLAPPSPPSATALAPQPEPEPDAALRAQLEGHKDELLACMGGKRVALELTYQDAQLSIELGAPLRDSPEQACVRQVLRELTAPAGTGRVIHVLSSDR